MAYTPTLYQKGDQVRTARSVADGVYYEFNGWMIAGAAPDPDPDLELITRGKLNEAMGDISTPGEGPYEAIVDGMTAETIYRMTTVGTPGRTLLDDIIAAGLPGGGGASDADIAGFVNGSGPTSEALNGRFQRALGIATLEEHGGDPTGGTSSTAALAAALSEAKYVYAGEGTFVFDDATRLNVKSYQAIVGSPSMRTNFSFTHADGGIHLGDTLGPGGAYVYRPHLANVNITGNDVANKLITGMKVEEARFTNVELHDWVDAGAELEDTSLLFAKDFTAARAPGNESRVGVRLKGTAGYVRFENVNFYACTPYEIAGAAVSNFHSDGWYEGIPSIVNVNNPGAVTSIGVMNIKGHAISTLNPARIFRYVAGTGLNTEMVDWSDLSVYFPNTTASLISLSAVDNSAATFRVRSRGAVVSAPNITHLASFHAAQAWYLAHVDHQDIVGVPTSKWWSALTFAAGGCWPKPIRANSSGDPNTVITAPSGSTYQDVNTGDVWVQGANNVVSSEGWVKTLLDGVMPLVKGPTAIQSPTAVDNDFGVDLFAVVRSLAESHDAGANALRVNGAGQVRAGWDDADSYGAFLAQTLNRLIGYDAMGITSYLGGLTLSAQAAADRVQIGTGVFGMPKHTTAARPSAVTAGESAAIYDTDLDRVFVSDGAVWKPGATMHRDVITASGNYTIPATTLRIRMRSGGGGGGGGGSALTTGGVNQVGGGGGEAGHVLDEVITGLTVGDVLAITVGAGGNGGVGGAPNGAVGTPGSNGAGCTITGTGVALATIGGTLGAGSAANSVTAIGGGAGNITSTNSVLVSGGGGFSGSPSAPPRPGSGAGGGGGGAANSTNGGGGGGVGTGTTRALAGSIAASGTTTGVAGASAPANSGCGGGGGGGGSRGGSGGNGGAGGSGLVEIFWVG